MGNFKIKGLRWWVLSLIGLVTIINYLDRNTLSIMWPGIVKDLNLLNPDLPKEEYAMQSKQVYSYIYMFFMVAYGFSQLLSGKLYDKIGTRLGFMVSVLIWSISDALNAFARGITSLSIFRAMLGLGEAGPWPGATKSNAEWFPVKERALAQGIFGAGASIGAILSPVIIALLYTAWGWKATFLIVGSLGLLWLLPWWIVNKKLPKEHPWITDQEREYILSGQPESKLSDDKPLSWGQLLRQRKSYAVILGRFFIDPIWWMFITWLPIYLFEVYGFNVKEIGLTAWVPYIGAAVGSISGGWFSGKLIKGGRSVNFARKLAISIGCGITLPTLLATAFVKDANTAVILMAFILAGFQFAITNIQTLASDLYSGKTVGSLAGLGGAAAVIGIIISIYFVPYITAGGNWFWFFMMGASLVPLSLISVFVMGGKIEPVFTGK